jgi:hypothetical protein
MATPYHYAVRLTYHGNGLTAPLADALHGRFGNDGVVIEPFDGWNGRNNISARKEGKDKLIGHLKGLQDKYGKKVKYYIVAHSHGGNVALYALRDAKYKYPIGLACLATPFIVARSRILAGNEDLTLRVIFSMFTLLLVLAFSIINVIELPEYWEILVPMSVIVIGAPFIGLIFRYWNNHKADLLTELNLSNLAKKQLLIVRAPGDEASALLLTCQFISQLIVGIYNMMCLLRDWMGKIVKDLSKKWILSVLIMVGGFLVGIPSVAYLFNSQLPLVVSLLLVLILTLAYTCIAISFFAFIRLPQWSLRHIDLLLGITLVPLSIIISILLIPFGWQLALGSIFLDVTAEATPPGSWQVDLLDPEQREINQDDFRLLQHSIHSDPRAHLLICEWMGRVFSPAAKQQSKAIG